MTPERATPPGGGPGAGSSSSQGSDGIDFSEPCPDCVAPWVDAYLMHGETCPLGLGLDEMREADAAWFEMHPSATTRERPAHWSEIAMQRHAGPYLPEGVHWVATVTQLAPGVRYKRFTGYMWLYRPW